MRPKLFKYQLDGIAWLKRRKFALLADEMGLGKSAQAILAIESIDSKLNQEKKSEFASQGHRILVICPAIARENWKREFEKFSKVKSSFDLVFTKQKKLSDSQSPDTERHVIIMSYEGAVAVEDTGGYFDAIIIDEAHYLKSIDAKRTKAILGAKGLIRKLKPNGKLFALTGTPSPNHAGELWIWLYTFGVTRLSYWQFATEFCEIDDNGFGKKITGTKLKAIPKLRELLDKIMLRRTVSKVMDQLPPISFTNHVVPPNEVVLDAAISFVKYSQNPADLITLQNILKKEQGIIDGILKSGMTESEIMKALEATAQSVMTLRRYVGLQKVDGIADILEPELASNPYSKIVIFAIHKDTIEGLRQRLAKFGAITLYGGTPANKKDTHIMRFQGNPKCRVMICNIQEAGTAITLHASNQVVFAEESWVPADNIQAAKRCHRIGQERPVFVRTFSVAGSIDEHVSKVLAKKMSELDLIYEEKPLTENTESDSTGSTKTEKPSNTDTTLEELLS